MAWTDPYVSIAEYKARVPHASAADDAAIEEVALSVSRWLERQLGRDRRHPRVFNQSAASTTRTFDTSGSTRLYIDDLVSVDSEGIAFDGDIDGTYSTTFDLTDAWCIGYPLNAAEESEPYTALELLPLTSNSTLLAWTPGRARVQITGTWGWPEVPGPIKELTILLTRQLRDLHESGVTLQMDVIENAAQVAPGANGLLRDLKRQYSLRIPGVA